MAGSRKKNEKKGKSPPKNKALEKSKKSKRSRSGACAAPVTPSSTSSSTSNSFSIVSSSTSVTPTSKSPNDNSSNAASTKNTARSLIYTDVGITSTSAPVKSSSKVKKPAYSVNFCDSSDTFAECLKYVENPDDVPKDQESQLRLLLDQYKTTDVRTAFCQLIGKVGGLAVTAFNPLPTRKTQLIKSFLSLIYDTKSMLVDTSKDAFK